MKGCGQITGLKTGRKLTFYLFIYSFVFLTTTHFRNTSSVPSPTQMVTNPSFPKSSASLNFLSVKTDKHLAEAGVSSTLSDKQTLLVESQLEIDVDRRIGIPVLVPVFYFFYLLFYCIIFSFFQLFNLSPV